MFPLYFHSKKASRPAASPVASGWPYKVSEGLPESRPFLRCYVHAIPRLHRIGLIEAIGRAQHGIDAHIRQRVDIDQSLLQKGIGVFGAPADSKVRIKAAQLFRIMADDVRQAGELFGAIQE